MSDPNSYFYGEIPWENIEGQGYKAVLLGIGGEAEVTLGSWNGRKVAVKRFRQDLEGIKAPLETLVRELTITSKWKSCDQIVQVIGYSIAPQRFALVMEYMPEGSLTTVLEKYDLSWREKDIIGIGIGKGIQFLHNKGIIHRDLKPSNILMDQSLNPKLSDFGISKLPHFVTIEPQQLIEGSLPYRAPELYGPNPVTVGFAQDIYSYGMILWQIGAECPPFKDNDLEEIREKHRNKIQETISGSWPSHYQKAISCAWNLKPALRPKALDIVEEIEFPTFLSACKAGNIRVAQKKIHGRSFFSSISKFINQRDENGFTVLHHLARDSKHLPNLGIVKFLLKHQADPELRRSGGRNSLDYAIEAQDLRFATCLIENGHINVNSLEDLLPDSALSPLGQAIFWNNKEMVKLLLDHGAFFYQIDDKGNTHLGSALEVAFYLGHIDIARVIVMHPKYKRSKDRIGEMKAYLQYENKKEVHHFLSELTGGAFCRNEDEVALVATWNIPEKVVFSFAYDYLKCKPERKTSALTFRNSKILSRSVLGNFLLRTRRTLKSLTIRECHLIDFWDVTELLNELKNLGMKFPYLEEINVSKK